MLYSHESKSENYQRIYQRQSANIIHLFHYCSQILIIVHTYKIRSNTFNSQRMKYTQVEHNELVKQVIFVYIYAPL